MALPVAAGLAGTALPAFRDGAAAFATLAAWPGLPRGALLSLGTGIAATLLSLTLTLLILAAFAGTPTFARIRRLIAPLLSVPHAAAALGLAFLIAPSGWIARALSPWATGWQAPPDLLILNDPWGVSLTLGLVAKELPFLLLMALAALPQIDADRRLATAATLGYGRIAGFAFTTLPALYAQLRLPVYAVLAYGMTVVDMAMILGPTLPPTLSTQIVLWMGEASLGQRDTAAAAAVLQFALVLAAIALWRLAEVAGRRLLISIAVRGHRHCALDRPAAGAARLAAAITGGSLILGLAGLALWSVAGLWQFPDALPENLSLRTWAGAAPVLSETMALTLAIAAAATLAALALSLGCLEAEARFNLTPTHRALTLLYLPLLVPQVAFLPGLQGLALAAGLDGDALAVAAAHLIFVLPYVFLSLAGPFRAWDRRIAISAATLGASPAAIFWRLRLPMLLAPVLTASAVGIAVSVGQYLPTLLIGGGRVETLTTEAVALSSGGNRRLIGAYAVLQMVLPALGFGLALLIPGQIWRNRRDMRGVA
ncbi:ABC transporter permease [Paragemmobacter ruber]|uniref:ABC transporter permease subunit n=1 Tax=Paragemmobacter ruber TaxID=1985673 RepID=A0ABW9Y892_9RHOB|nr:ABC transporter permease subunit [Rhodobacter ruber]NBE08806.1 ABC transporter permease subunit [Rhodobacter ruber]